MDTAFRGKGSVKTSGRWHHKGTQVAYASEHSGVAVLEELVWLGNYEVARKSSYVLLPLHFNPDRHLETLDESVLPDDWDPFPHPEATRALGPQWYEEERSAVLAVPSAPLGVLGRSAPSAVLPVAKNYLINPFHPDVHELERGEPVPFSWNTRLFQRTQQGGEDDEATCQRRRAGGSPRPISCIHSPPDVPRVADRADIANLKLMKCGGLRETQRMIHTARAHGLEVMLGCMIESNASIAAAAHLAPLLDCADLDGSLLLAEDPYAGAPLPNGRVDLEDISRAGTGAQRRTS